MAGRSQPIRKYYIACTISGGHIGSAEFVLVKDGKLDIYDDLLQVNSQVSYLNKRFNHHRSPVRWVFERRDWGEQKV
jgi:hypothetical protein